MTFEETLNLRLSSPDYSCLAGSRLYGTHRETSDTDIRGFIIPPFETLIGVKNFEQYQHPHEDTKIYSLHKFLKLVLMGDPGCTEMLFVPEHQILSRNRIADVILENREIFLSQNIRRRLMGFSYSEFRKAMGVKVDRNVNRDDYNLMLQVRNFCKEHDFDQDEIEEVADLLLKKNEIKLVSSLKGMGEKRKNEFDKYGFGVSSASHSIRLLGELKELLTTKKIVFPRYDADLLKDIRNGRVEKGKVEEIYNSRLKEVEEIDESKIVIPNKPNYDASWKIYQDLIKVELKNEI